MNGATVGCVLEKPTFSARNAASFHEATTGVDAGLHDGSVTENGHGARVPGANKAWPVTSSLSSCRGFHPALICRHRF